MRWWPLFLGWAVRDRVGLFLLGSGSVGGSLWHGQPVVAALGELVLGGD